MLAIGRIGCYFAGCCTGKEREKFIVYKDNYSINNKLKKGIVDVTPTIFLEIVLQFLIAVVVYKSDNGVLWFGLLNALLIIGTNYWRLEKRMENQKHYIPVISLLIFSILSQYSCGKMPSTPVSITFKTWKLIVPLIIGITVSNNYNVIHIEHKLNNIKNNLI